jgi:hypothetical protein
MEAQTAVFNLTRKDRKMNAQLHSIADEIVHLVECTDGPVTLAQIAKEVPGFAKPVDARACWAYFYTYNDREVLLWDNMTKAGLQALQEVIKDRRVAVQFVSPIVYITEAVLSEDPHAIQMPESNNWVPVVVLPKAAGNLDTPNMLLRVSAQLNETARGMLAAEGRPEVYTPVVPA